MKGFLKALFCLTMALILSMGTSILAEAKEPVLRQISVGYWDIWRYSDGKTWQHTGKPGDTKEYAFEIPVPESLAGYSNIAYKIKPITSISAQEYNQYGGWLGESYIEFRFNKLRHLPENYLLINDKTVSFRLEGYHEDIKQKWQGQLVEGRRYYLPVVVEWHERECLWVEHSEISNAQRGWRATGFNEAFPFEDYNQGDKARIIQALLSINEYQNMYIETNTNTHLTYGIIVGYVGEKERISFQANVFHQKQDYMTNPLLTREYTIKNGEMVAIFLPAIDHKFRHTEITHYTITTDELANPLYILLGTGYSR